VKLARHQPHTGKSVERRRAAVPHSAAVSTIRIAELAVPADPTATPTWAAQGWHDVGVEHMLDALGHDDFIEPAAGLVASHADQRHEVSVVLLALTPTAAAGRPLVPATSSARGAGVPAPPGAPAQPGAPAPPDTPARPEDVLGYCRLSMPVKDNTHLVHIDLAVRPGARRRGIGTMLWRAAESRARAAGRTVVSGWTTHVAEADDGDPGALVPPTGVGRLRADDTPARFLRDQGFELVQTTRHSMLTLPPAEGAAAAFRAEAERVAGEDYRLVQWRDRTPEKWLDAVAVLQARMSTDAPMGDLDLRAEVWDAQRVRETDEQITRTGDGYVLSAVEHVPSGQLAAFTQIMTPAHLAEVAFQYNTLVRADHRGRRLGLLVKAVNLQLLAATRPGVRRVHTWNAGENAHMLAINERLGFARASTEGVWQLRLGESGVR
jgi:GNAT superfamily N-acetyltransferase